MQEIKEERFFRLCQQGSVELLQQLLDSEESVDLDFRGEPSGVTAVMVAVKARQPSVLRLLLERGADANLRTRGAQLTALHLAASLGALEEGRLLLQLGAAEVNAASELGQTPLLMALLKGHADMVRLLVDAGASTETLLYHAVGRDDLAVATMLLDAGVDANECVGENQKTALHLAARENNQRLARLLLQRGANAEARATVGNGTTPLLIACRYGAADVARVLLEHGADPNTTFANAPVVMMACRFEHWAIVDQFLRHPQFDANVMYKGESLFCIFCDRLGRVGLARALLKHPAFKPTERDQRTWESEHLQLTGSEFPRMYPERAHEQQLCLLCLRRLADGLRPPVDVQRIILSYVLTPLPRPYEETVIACD